MRNYTYTDGGHVFKRVNKTTAQRAYNNGLRVVLCPCNLRPGYPWHPEISISGKAESSFETQLNAFEFYNLRGKETGRYTAFFVPVRMVDLFTGEALTVESINVGEEYDYSYIGKNHGF